MDKTEHIFQSAEFLRRQIDAMSRELLQMVRLRQDIADADDHLAHSDPEVSIGIDKLRQLS
jgi:hypothetical protein